MKSMKRREFLKALTMAGVAPAILHGTAIAQVAGTTLEVNPMPLKSIVSVSDFGGGWINIERMVSNVHRNLNIDALLADTKPYTFRVDLEDGTQHFFQGHVRSIVQSSGDFGDTIIENIEIQLTNETDGEDPVPTRNIPVNAIPGQRKVDMGVHRTAFDSCEADTMMGPSLKEL